MERSEWKTRKIESARVKAPNQRLRKIMHRILPTVVKPPVDVSSPDRLVKKALLVTESGKSYEVGAVVASAEGHRTAFRGLVQRQGEAGIPITHGEHKHPSEVPGAQLSYEASQQLRADILAIDSAQIPGSDGRTR